MAPTAAATAIAASSGESDPSALEPSDWRADASVDVAPRTSASDGALVQYGKMPLTQSGNLNDASVSKYEHGEHTTEVQDPAAFAVKHCAFFQIPALISSVVSVLEHSFAIGGDGRTVPAGGATNWSGGGSGMIELHALSGDDCGVSVYLQ